MLKINNIVVKNSVFSVLQIVLSTLSYVVIYYLILHKLGKTELGVWSIITSLPIAISVFGSGVSGCILRYIPVYNVQKDKLAFNEIIFNGFVFNIAFGGLIVVLGYLFSSQILRFLFSNSELPVRYILLFRISLLTFFISFITSVILYAIDGLQLIFRRNKIIIFSSSIFCVVASVFIYYWELKGILFAQLIQSILLLIFAIRVLIKVELFDHQLFRFNKIYINLFLTYGQSFQLISVTILIFDPITKYFLNKYFNLSTVGVYDLVSRAVTQIRLIIVSAIQVIIPLVSKNNEERGLDVNAMFSKTNRGASLLSFILFSTLICISVIIIGFFDRGNINQYLFILILLCVAYHFNIMASTAYSILLGLGKLKSIIISHMLSSILNIVIFILLGDYLMDNITVLPTALAIAISSGYLICTFKRDFGISYVLVSKSDFIIKVVSLFTIILSVLFVLFQVNMFLWIILFVVHAIVILRLVLKNDFFVNLINKILNK
ncbi:hypothetical protein ACNQF7_04240 [Flavobacterium sp. RSP29]|uniref:hypothetical protein n=1 Tax=Flavobacterium sp. RSP29 TaxID=3401731 RepID=UPI003AAF26BA